MNRVLGRILSLALVLAFSGLALPAPSFTEAKKQVRLEEYERLLVELHPTLLPALGSSVEAVIDELLAAGYKAWDVKHDRETTRRAAYARRPDPASVVRSWQVGGAVGPWPHFLFARHTPFPDTPR